MRERFPEIYNFGPERLGIHFKDKFVLEEYSSGVTRLTEGIANSIISKRPLKRIRVEMQMQLNTPRVLGH